MPDSQRPEYNPTIMGFVKNRGPVLVPLKKAREAYGRLPSEYHLVSGKKGRKTKKALNLDIGRIITGKLKGGQVNLKKTVIDFFKAWHRSYEDEFGVSIPPLLNLNEPAQVRRIMEENRNLLLRLLQMDPREEVRRLGLIRTDVLNSIAPEQLCARIIQILSKRLRRMPNDARARQIRGVLAEVNAHCRLHSLRNAIGLPENRFPKDMIEIYADDIAACLHHVSTHIPLDKADGLKLVQGRGVEFQFASRDGSYLALGKQTGDCTADKPLFQADRDIENIYWTVFPWILDRNYQILKLFCEGEFVLKAHLLPLFWVSPEDQRMILAVDAIETARVFRSDLQDRGREDLIARRLPIFTSLIEQVRWIARRMGIRDVYAERFSNTAWVREELARFPEILIDVHQLIKLDELEDIFELARMLGREDGQSEVNHVFMELQMKNTSLLPGVSRRVEGIKSFAVIQGDPTDGIPMKRVIGI